MHGPLTTRFLSSWFVLGLSPAVGLQLAAPRFDRRAQRSAVPPLAALAGGTDEKQQQELRALLERAGMVKDGEDPVDISELSAGFCNYVYLCELGSLPECAEGGEECNMTAFNSTVIDVDSTVLGRAACAEVGLAAPGARRPLRPVRRVVAKLFSPLAKLRIVAARRGVADESAAQHGLGPGVHFRSEDGLITDFVDGRTLTEDDIHEPEAKAGVLRALAPRLAALHSVRLPAIRRRRQRVVLWEFLRRMLREIKRAPQGALPEGISSEQVLHEVQRMQTRFDALQLPIVNGHGDLKPSNVMASLPSSPSGANQISFIDFELAGAHYRGYDLFKLFRTSGTLSRSNMISFLHEYLTHVQKKVPAFNELNELRAETLAFEPLTWLEAAVFFFFAMVTYPANAHEWAPLAEQRWNAYLASAHLVEEDGEATRMLRKARARRRPPQQLAAV